MQCAALDIGEVVTLVVCDEIDNSPFGESGRLIENEPPFLDTGSKWTHVTTVGRPADPGKWSDTL